MIISFETFSDEINLYSAKKEHLIKPLTDLFTKDTGIKVNIITTKPSHRNFTRRRKFASRCFVDFRCW